LNAEAGSGTLRKVEPRLRMMLTLARRAQRQTSGRFDARTLEVLEGLGERAQVPYAPGLVPRIAGDAGWIRRTGRDLVSLDTAIDSGGLGKGLGLRWALAAALRGTSRLTGLLLEAGGDVAAIGGPVPGGAWQVGIEDPAEPAQVLAVVTLRDAALATSSTSVRRWTGPTGQPVHHLIDPSTWQPADGGLLAVTVVHTDPAWAEIWSKAYFIAGAAAIGPEARARGMAVWWVEGDRSFHLTPAAREHTEWLRDD
ncbi:MAG TPA: FAD:protein FMN transferase, partial [Candidatus Limnocylindria bacterium]|nr:FAD:protein FMN transferase [Candidatus Limnocylindria bacterium]